MRPTPIPDEEVWEGAVRRVIGPPGGDLFGDVAPVDALIEIKDGSPVFRIRCIIEEDDVEQIERGARVFWLSWWGEHLHPFSVGMSER